MTRPRVIINMAPSLDGRIAPARKRAPFVMSRHGEDHERMLALRSRADVVMTGATNVRADDPDLMPCPLRLVVTTSGAGIEPTAHMFDPALGGEAIVTHAASMSQSKRRSLATRATLVELGEGEVDVLALLEWLARERGCRTVLCEGGGVLNAALFAARAVDSLYLTVVPRVLGGSAAPGLIAGAGFDPNEIPDPQLASCERIGDELFLEYRFVWHESFL